MSDEERFRAEAIALVAKESMALSKEINLHYRKHFLEGPDVKTREFVSVHEEVVDEELIRPVLARETERRLRGDALIRKLTDALKDCRPVGPHEETIAAAERYLGGQ